MRFNCKTPIYKGKKVDQGFFNNAYVETHSTFIDVALKRLTIGFRLVYDVDGQKHVLEDNPLAFFETGRDTLILNSDNVPTEIMEFVMTGGVYDISKVTEWGTPTFESVKNYFDLASVWSDLEFKEQPLKQLAIDWVMNNVYIQGYKMSEEFIYAPV